MVVPNAEPTAMLHPGTVSSWRSERTAGRPRQGRKSCTSTHDRAHDLRVISRALGRPRRTARGEDLLACGTRDASVSLRGEANAKTERE
jgi:hypothetical protein